MIIAGQGYADDDSISGPHPLIGNDKGESTLLPKNLVAPFD